MGIALSQSTLRAVLADMLSCLLRHGLTRIIVINGHGGNVQAVHEVTQDIYRESKILIPSFYLWRVGYSYLPGILGAETAAKSAGHGADPLTSVMMHLFPEWIRHDMIPPKPTAPTVMGSPVINFGAIRFAGEASIMARYMPPISELSSWSANGVTTMPGLIELTRAPRSPQLTALACTRR